MKFWFIYIEPSHDYHVRHGDDTTNRNMVKKLCTSLAFGCFVLVLIDVTHVLNTLRPRQNARRFPHDIFKRTFLNENIRIPIKVSLKFVPKGPINNISALVQIMAWRRPGDKPLSEPMIVKLPTHVCVTRPQWVKVYFSGTMYLQCQPSNMT